MDNPKRKLEKSHLLGAIRYSPEGSYVYLNNPKCACSTVKYALWSMEKESGRIDYLPDSKQLHGLGFWSQNYDFMNREDVFTFTVVRNPFTRILSAYLDKIARKNLIRDIFCRLYDIPQDKEISFRYFLETIRHSPSHHDDPHWRLQTDNILFDALRIDFIGHLEHIDQDLPYILSRISGVSTFAPRQDHKTGAAKYVGDYFGATEIDLVREKYAAYFENFGYGCDLTVTSPQATARISQQDNAVMEFLAAISEQKTLTKLTIPGTHIDKAMALDQSNPVYPAFKASLLIKARKFEQARTFAQLALDLDGDYAQAHNVLALALRGKNMVEQALPHARRAVSLARHQHAYWWCLASLLYTRGELTGAEKAIRTAIEMANTEVVRNLVLLAQILSAQNRHEEAIKCCDKVTQMEPLAAEILLNVGAIYSKAGRLETAIELVEKVRQKHPAHIPARVRLSVMLRKAGRIDEAKSAIEEAVAIDPQNRRVQQEVQHYRVKANR